MLSMAVARSFTGGVMQFQGIGTIFGFFPIDVALYSGMNEVDISLAFLHWIMMALHP